MSVTCTVNQPRKYLYALIFLANTKSKYLYVIRVLVFTVCTDVIRLAVAIVSIPLSQAQVNRSPSPTNHRELSMWSTCGIGLTQYQSFVYTRHINSQHIEYRWAHHITFIAKQCVKLDQLPFLQLM